ncbi:MAG TPA: Na+/H+ antiporter NhaA [Vicinamibacterales bacterium]|nr:Na+/H+ antiporter NhaA [Vicinamibacterales bacterium]
MRVRAVRQFVLDNSLLLLAGTAAAVAWANLSASSYDAIAHPLHFWINDVGMVFFFALAAKEVFEATLPGGALASPRQALAPLAAAVGGMAAPAMIFLTLASTLGPPALARGWAIPCATDIAFSAMVARLIFPGSHPAIPFLLLLAIADDALGLIILAVFYPSGGISVAWLGGLMSVALVLCIWLRRRRVRSFWAYVAGPGVLSWTALYLGGIHPALALVPIVPFMPHEARDRGLFDPSERYEPDTLNRFEHWWAVPVQFILLFFGFANAGVPFEQIGPGTYYVLAALLLGKPIGILTFTAAARLAGARLPARLELADLLTVGIVASIGFTVSLFFATAAFPTGVALAETKMGALLSFFAAPLALAAARVLRVPRQIAMPTPAQQSADGQPMR